MKTMIIENLAEKALDLGLRIVFAIICFLIGVQLIKLVRKIVRKTMERSKADVGVTQFVDSFIKAALYVVLVFMLATSFGVDAASIVALLGSAGVAIGLAIQGSLSNLAGGVLILLLKPFKIGDYIIENGTHMEGVVSEIQIFYTKLTTADNKVIVLPNGTLANNSLTNLTTAKTRRLDIAIGIDYSSDIKKAREVLLAVLHGEEKILKEREAAVVVDELGDSAVKLIVRCWVNNEDYWDCRARLNENCKYALDEAGIGIPFPQLDVYLKERTVQK